MFEKAVSEFDSLPIKEKQNRITDEIKLMIAIIEKICIERNIDYREIKSKEILALKQENVTEDDYLTALYVYVEYLKEVIGGYLLDDVSK